MTNPFKPKTTRSIVIGKRPVQQDGAETPGAEQKTETIITIGGKTFRVPPVPKWVLPAAAGIAAILLLVVIIGICSKPKVDEAPVTPVLSDGRFIVAVDTDAALAGYTLTGDIVRIYGADGTPVQALRYVEVSNAADGALLLLLDEEQTSALVQEGEISKVVLVSHAEPERSAQLLDLQARINDPQITLTLQKTISLAPGTSADLEYAAAIQPSEAALPAVNWASSDPSVASVADGTVSAKEVGETVITVVCGGMEAQCKVTVIDMKLSETEIVLGIEEEAQITAEVGEFTASWSSADPSIATVDAEGKITGIAPGTTTVTATCRDVSVSCEVTVGYRAEVAQLDHQFLDMTVGDTAKLTPSIYPSADMIDVGSFTSSNTAVLTVAEDGTVTAVAEGTATVTYKCGEAQATCSVNVEKKD